MINQLLLGTSTYFIHVSFQLSVACQDEQAPIVLTNLFGTLQTFPSLTIHNVFSLYKLPF